MDKNGLFYQMGLCCTYLSGEDKRVIRGIEFNKHKERFMVVLFCNSDGMHLLTPRYIVTASRPFCFQSRKNFSIFIQVQFLEEWVDGF